MHFYICNISTKIGERLFDVCKWVGRRLLYDSHKVFLSSFKDFKEEKAQQKQWQTIFALKNDFKIRWIHIQIDKQGKPEKDSQVYGEKDRFGLVRFYGISTTVGYLKPNPFLYI